MGQDVAVLLCAPKTFRISFPQGLRGLNISFQYHSRFQKFPLKINNDLGLISAMSLRLSGYYHHHQKKKKIGFDEE